MQGGVTPNICRRMRSCEEIGSNPIDDGSALRPPPPKKSVVPGFNPGNHSTFRNDSILWGCSDRFVFPLNLMKETWLTKVCLRVRCGARGKGASVAAASGVVFSLVPNKARRSTTPKSIAFPDHAQWIKMPTRGMYHHRRAQHHTTYDDSHLPKEFRTRPGLYRIIRMMPQRLLND